MSGKDLKFFGIVLVLAAVGYFAFFHMDWKRFRGGLQRQQEPIATFVPEGTPGAKTLKEIQEENARRSRNLGGRIP